jgi:hypothetical protein
VVRARIFARGSYFVDLFPGTKLAAPLRSGGAIKVTRIDGGAVP